MTALNLNSCLRDIYSETLNKGGFDESGAAAMLKISPAPEKGFPINYNDLVA